MASETDIKCPIRLSNPLIPNSELTNLERIDCTPENLVETINWASDIGSIKAVLPMQENIFTYDVTRYIIIYEIQE